MKNKILKFLVCMMLICALFIITPITTSADQEGDYTYTISKGNATITKYTGAGGVIAIPSTLGGYPTVTIGYQAFYYETSLTSVIIPNSVTTLESQAFYSCTSMKTVTIPDSVTSIGDNAFYYCSSLEDVNIGNNVTTIGYQAFYSCIALTSITIPNSVISIGNSALAYCSALTSIVIPDSVISIAYTTFSYCSSLESVTIGNRVTSIGDTMFAYCSALKSVIIGDSVTSIGNSAFAHCSSLPSVIIPNSVTIINDNAFYFCSSLSNVTIGKSVMIIGEGVFHSCSSLTSITFLGLAAPINVDLNWKPGTPVEIRGHAYTESNFPAPGEVWNRLTMGTAMPGNGTVENKPPIIDFNWTPTNPSPNQFVIFDVSWSYDPDGSIKLYEWDWNNDGVYDESHTTLTTIYRWSKAGSYPVTLKVTDDDGANNTKTITVTVNETKTPGFELILSIIVIALFIIVSKRKNGYNSKIK